MKVLQYKIIRGYLKNKTYDIIQDINIFLSQIPKEDIYEVKPSVDGGSNYLNCHISYWTELNKCQFCGENVVDDICPNKCNEVKDNEM